LDRWRGRICWFQRRGFIPPRFPAPVPCHTEQVPAQLRTSGKAPGLTNASAENYHIRDKIELTPNILSTKKTMNRRRFLAVSATLGTALTTLPSKRSLLGANESNKSEVKGLAATKSKLTPPAKGSIPVAILISEGLNVIDFSGPWGVFESV